MGGGVIRLEGNGLAVFGDGGVELACIPKSVAKIVVSKSEVRLQPSGLAVFRNSSAGLTLIS
jgi:hypothetical protein